MKINTAEKTILENMERRYKWIARDGDGVLYAFVTKPEKLPDKDFNCWTGLDAVKLPFKSIFKWVDEESEKPYEIERILQENN